MSKNALQINVLESKSVTLCKLFLKKSRDTSSNKIFINVSSP